MLRKNPSANALTHRTEGSNLTHYSPWDDLSNLRRQMDELFGSAFGYTPLSRMIPSETMGFEPAVDIYETDDNVMLFAAIPGCEPGSVHVEATQDSVTIQGERKPLYENEKATPHRQSWLSASGNFSVSYSLPCEIDPNNVKATCKNGILQLQMPKSEQAKSKSVQVQIQG